MWASDRMYAFLLVLTGLATSGVMWVVTRHAITPYQVLAALPMVTLGLLYAVRGYPVGIGLIYGKDKEREEVKKLMAKLAKWLKDNPED